ncbi:MAG: hypothetical protein ACYTGX_16385, partial [Planctomycetota bacterium]
MEGLLRDSRLAYALGIAAVSATIGAFVVALRPGALTLVATLPGGPWAAAAAVVLRAQGTGAATHRTRARVALAVGGGSVLASLVAAGLIGTRGAEAYSEWRRDMARRDDTAIVALAGDAGDPELRALALDTALWRNLPQTAGLLVAGLGDPHVGEQCRTLLPKTGWEATAPLIKRLQSGPVSERAWLRRLLA